MLLLHPVDEGGGAASLRKFQHFKNIFYIEFPMRFLKALVNNATEIPC